MQSTPSLRAVCKCHTLYTGHDATIGLSNMFVEKLKTFNFLITLWQSMDHVRKRTHRLSGMHLTISAFILARNMTFVHPFHPWW